MEETFPKRRRHYLSKRMPRQRLLDSAFSKFESVLDGLAECDWMASMRIQFFAALLGVAVLAAGCVNTVTGEKTAGVPFIKDSIEARYERPADQVFQAAKEAVKQYGVLVNEGTLYGQTNAVGNLVKTVQGRVNQRTVWVRVEQIDQKVSDVTVQTRTQGGMSDIDLAAQIDKQIAVNLSH